MANISKQGVKSKVVSLILWIFRAKQNDLTLQGKGFYDYY